MTTFRPTEIHQLAIQAKLNFALGARVYDEIFAGFEVLEIVGDELRGWATSEYRAAVIDIDFSGEVARIAQAVTGRPVRRTSFVLRGLRHDTEEQPTWEADDGTCVVNAVDPIPRIRKCPLGNPAHIQLCPLHRRLDNAIAMIEQEFGRASLAEVLETSTKSGGQCRTLVTPTVRGGKR